MPENAKKKSKVKAASAVEAATLGDSSTLRVANDVSREEARLRITCALLTSPRFSVKIEDAGVQDLLIATANQIAEKLGL